METEIGKPDQKMRKKGDPKLEMLAAAISLFVLTADRESFGYMHMIMGAVLGMFVLRSFRCQKDIYGTLLFSAVLALLAVLAVGRPIDWLRDSCFRKSVSRDEIFSIAWLVFGMLAFIVESAMHGRIKLKWIIKTTVATSAVGIVLMAMGLQRSTAASSEQTASAGAIAERWESSAPPVAWTCTTPCQSYEVVEAGSLLELKAEIQTGLDKAGWRPQGGVAYDSKRECYLQVMIHAGKVPTYP